MIPVTNAIVTCLVAVAATAAGTVWALAGYWRAKADDAYQDGHSAGIATQIARQRRAAGRQDQPGRHALGAYTERVLPARPGEPVTDVIVADVTDAGRHRARPAAGGVIPFPEGLPPGLREYAVQVLAKASRPAAAPPAQVRGPASIQRVIDRAGPAAR